MDYNKPALIEFQTKYYIKNSLKEVRQLKNKYITIFANIFLLLLFIGVVGGILLYKYKGKATQQETLARQHDQKLYLFQKLQQYSYDKQKESQRLITNLPVI